MKKNIHPDYDYVIFRDTSCGRDFRIRSTCISDQTVVWEDGNIYPLVTLDVSSASHLTYTGEKRKVTAEGRIAQFAKRFGNRSSRA